MAQSVDGSAQSFNMAPSALLAWTINRGLCFSPRSLSLDIPVYIPQIKDHFTTIMNNKKGPSPSSPFYIGTPISANKNTTVDKTADKTTNRVADKIARPNPKAFAKEIQASAQEIQAFIQEIQASVQKIQATTQGSHASAREIQTLNQKIQESAQKIQASTQGIQECPEEIPVPPFMKKGAIFYHATTKTFADNILAKGIDPKNKGNVNALGPGFYTVKELGEVWNWMQPDDVALDSFGKNDLERKTFISEQHSIIIIELVAVPTLVCSGKSDEAEVIVGGGDVMWTNNGLHLVKVIGEITGKIMRTNRSFEAWYEQRLKVEKDKKNKKTSKL